MSRWEFIGTESCVNSQWIAQNDYVEGMIWEFCPDLLTPDIVVGRIIESTPAISAECSVPLSYIYNVESKVLTISIATTGEISPDTPTYSDGYRVLYVGGVDGGSKLLKLSLMGESLTEEQGFRYILRLTPHQMV